MLEVLDVSKSFGAVRAVDHVSFSVREGAMFGLLGPNGAGKTTTIRMILDILEPDQGEVRWDGRRVNADIRRSFGYLPEERGLYPKMKVRDQLVFFAKLHGIDTKGARRRVDILAEAFDLVENLDKTPQELSKGNQQKVQFLMATLHEPPLLILDEPFSGFDPLNVEIVKDAIRALSRRGTAIVMSSHRMEQVEELCDEIVLINHARTILSGNLREIKQNWPDKVVRITAPPDGAAPDWVRDARHVLQRDGVIDVALPVGADAAVLLQKALAAYPVTHFEVVEPSLNDIYIRYVRPEEALA